MTEEEVTKRIDRFEDSLNIRLARIEASVVLSPGSAFACVDHTRKLVELENRLTGMERKFWMAAGALAVITLLVSIFGQTIRQALHMVP